MPEVHRSRLAEGRKCVVCRRDSILITKPGVLKGTFECKSCLKQRLGLGRHKWKSDPSQVRQSVAPKPSQVRQSVAPKSVARAAVCIVTGCGPITGWGMGMSVRGDMAWR